MPTKGFSSVKAVVQGYGWCASSSRQSAPGQGWIARRLNWPLTGSR